MVTHALWESFLLDKMIGLPIWSMLKSNLWRMTLEVMAAMLRSVLGPITIICCQLALTSNRVVKNALIV